MLNIKETRKYLEKCNKEQLRESAGYFTVKHVEADTKVDELEIQNADEEEIEKYRKLSDNYLELYKITKEIAESRN